MKQLTEALKLEPSGHLSLVILASWNSQLMSENIDTLPGPSCFLKMKYCTSQDTDMWHMEEQLMAFEGVLVPSVNMLCISLQSP